MSEKVRDYLGPYITVILLPALKEATWLKDRGRYFDAVEKLTDVIGALYRKTDEGRKQIREWLNTIDQIETYANTYNSVDPDKTPHLRAKVRNLAAKILYRKIRLDIWDKIHAFGYFSNGNFEGEPILDPAMGQKSGKSKEQREGLVITSSRAGEHEKE